MGGPPPPPTYLDWTLEFIVEQAGVRRITLYCQPCRRRGIVGITRIVAKAGPMTKLKDVRFRCEKCNRHYVVPILEDKLQMEGNVRPFSK